MKLYATIKELAKAKKISIYRIEHDLNLSNGSISKWDHTMPAANKLDSVAKYLGFSAPELILLAKKR